MSSNQAVYAWLYIDGNIIPNGVDGCSYDRQMTKLIKLDVAFNYKQLSHIISAKLNIDTNIYQLKIMHRCFNPSTKMFGVAPVVDDDDVEVMFDLVLSEGLKNCVVELYLEKSIINSFGNELVDVRFAFNSVERNSSSHRDEQVGGENVEVSEEDDVESGGLTKKRLYMQRVDYQGRVSRGKNKCDGSGIPLYKSFDGSFMVASLKEPTFTMIGDVLDITDLKSGMVFVSREELAEIVHEVHYRSNLELKVTRASLLSWAVECKRATSGCAWTLKATKRKRHGFFEIMKVLGPHTCVNPIVTLEDRAIVICSNIDEVSDALVAVDPSQVAVDPTF